MNQPNVLPRLTGLHYTNPEQLVQWRATASAKHQKPDCPKRLCAGMRSFCTNCTVLLTIIFQREKPNLRNSGFLVVAVIDQWMIDREDREEEPKCN